MDLLLNDARFALRMLRAQRVFTATVVLTLALGIGASTAIFSVVDATLLKPLPFRTPDRLAFLWGVAGPQRAVRGASFVEVKDWDRLNRTFEHVAIYDETSLNLQTSDGAERVGAEMVSSSYFPMLGVGAAIGRVFTDEEDAVPDAHAVALISDGMWTTRFGRDRSIVGRTITLNEVPFTVVGVMPSGFKGLSFTADVWFPAAMAHANGAPTDLTDRGSRWLGAVGRLKPGVTMPSAQRDLERVATQLARDYPRSNKDRGVQLFSLRDSYLGSTRTIVLAVFGAVALLLLIACANVIGLQLVRATGRRREFALRIALGAAGQRLVQQLVVEGMLLALASAIVGLVVARWGLEALTLLVPAGLLPSYAAPRIDVTTFAFAFATAVGCGVVFGVVPALRGSRVNLTDSLKEGARGSVSGFGRGRRLGSQQLLVIGETAVALVLLVGAGLFVRSLQRQLAVHPGFDPRGVLRARFTVPPRYTAAERLRFVDELHRRVAATPSVRAVAIASDIPLGGATSASFIYVPEAQQAVRYYRHAVTPDFFTALGVSLVSGREFTTADRDSMPPVVMINDAMAKRFWPGVDPVGKLLRLGGDAAAPAVTIVGVVGDVHYRDLTTPLATTEPDVYFPIAQRTPASVEIAVRADLPPESVAAALRRELAALDRTIPLFSVEPLETTLAQQTASGRFASTLLAAFGAAALVLSAIGLYGTLSFLVGTRRRELGIRLALGATPRDVLSAIVGHGVGLAAIGVAVGVAASLVLTRWVASQLYHVTTHDPLVLIAVPMVLLLVSVGASWIPARRAAAVDPQIALRAD